MGVRTTADDKAIEAYNAVDTALKALTEIVVDQCWGTSDLTDDFIQKIEKSHQTLIQVRKDLSLCKYF